MDKLTFYALTGMFKVEEDSLETLKKRLSTIVELVPGLRGLIIEGVAVSVHIFDMDKLYKLLGVKTMENVKCYIEIGGDLHQVVYVDYECNGKRCSNAYPLPFTMDKLKDVFDVEYVQPQCLAAWKDRHLKIP